MSAESNTYIVTFELKQRADNINKFKEVLKSFPGFCPLNAYSWAISSPKSAEEIRDELMKVMSKGSRVFVIRSGTAAAWVNAYAEKNSEWLKKYL